MLASQEEEVTEELVLDEILEEALNESQIDDSSVNEKADVNDAQASAKSTNKINKHSENNIKRKPNSRK